MIANRLAGASFPIGTLLLNIPFMGQLTIGCDGMNGQIKFDTVGTGAIDYMATTTYPPNNVEMYSAVFSSWVTSSTLGGAMMKINVARNTGPDTRMATIWVNWVASGCRFQAHAIQIPRL
jgi:hypothetical protein